MSQKIILINPIVLLFVFSLFVFCISILVYFSIFCTFVFPSSPRAVEQSMCLARLRHLCTLFSLNFVFLYFCISIITQSNRAGYVAGPAEAQCPSLSTGSLCLWWVRNFCPPPDNIEALFSLTFSSRDDILHMLAREAPGRKSCSSNGHSQNSN